MTRRAFLKKYARKLAVALALIGLIAYTAGHAFGSSASSLLTSPLRAVTDRRIASAQAYLFRDEEVLVSDQTGLVDELVESGTKVSKNTAVARVAQGVSAAPFLKTEQESLDRINRSLRILTSSAPAAGDSAADANDYRAEASAAYMELCDAARSGDLSGISSIEERLLIAVNRYLLLAGKSDELDGIIAELEAQKNALLGDGELVSVYNQVRSGVFYGRGYVDGYESVYTINALESLTVEGFERLRSASPAEAAGQTVGKIVYGYSWYAVMELAPSVASGFTVGNEYEITFPENEGRTLKLTLERMDGNMAVFRADDCPEDFVYYRIQTAQITVGVQEGFYVPDTALHTVDGVAGVYVLENSTAYFRRISILYRGDGYCIVARPETSDTCEVYLNDLIILSGRNLYDGKVYE